MWKKIVFGLLLVISAVAGFFVAKGQVMLYHTLDNIDREYDTALENVDLKGIKVNSDDDIVNILIVGNDKRNDKAYSTDVGLTDTMIIATMDLKHKTLKMTSLMRDCYVEIPGHGMMKLNAAYPLGGIELLYRTIAQNFSVELDGYFEVDFNAFVDVVDAVGGVELELTESEASYLRTTNYIRKKKYRNVKAGKHTLNGHQALGYCRIRKGGVTTVNGLRDDYGRTWRQRTVISAIFSKVKSLPMTDWIDIANKVLKNLKTDLSNDKIIGYMTDVITLGTTEIHQLQIPVNGYYRGSEGEFSVGSCLVMTDGVNSAWNTAANKEALYQFIFKYNGKGVFQYGTFSNKE